ncbi:MAG: helix-turn-helix domain-containing protein, partial [Simplicispira sp.]|nr:helix-turn-helix domain-containing protein [Simplicispira sp.]
PREFAILCELARQAGRVVRREQLLQRVWSGDEEPSAGALEFQIHALRRKLGAEAIRTVRGVGYLMPRP